MPIYDPEKLHSELRKQIEGAEESMLYFFINHAGGVSFYVRHDSADGRPWAPSISESMKVEEDMFQIQRHCIEQLKVRGIITEPVGDDNFPTKEYWKWFRWWHSYVEGLSYEEWRVFETALNAHVDVSKWRPEGDWRDYEL